MTAIGATPRRFLGAHPMASAVVYVMTGALPLYLTSAQVLSLEADLGFDPARLGIATASYFGIGALMASTAGRWIRSRGATSGLRTGCVLAAVAALIAGLSPVWWVLPIATMVSGVANSFMQVGTNILVVQIARSDRQAISFGAKQGAIPLASSVAGVLLPVVGLALGWRWSYALAAMIALTVRTFVPDVPRLTERAASHGNDRFRIPRPLVYLAIAGACGGAAGNAVSFFVVPSAVQTGITEAAAGSVLAVSSALVVALRIGSGWVVDRRRTSGHYEMALMLGVGVIGCIGLALSQNILVYLVAMTLAMNGSWGWPGLFYYTVTSTNPDFPARASGVTLSGNLTGTLIGPFIVAQLADRGAYPAAWTLCAVLSFIAFVSMVMSGRTFRASIAGTGRSHHPAGDISGGTS
jgi:MFS family permease